MIKLGEIQTLKCVNTAEFGVYLGDSPQEKVLLPKKQVPEDFKVGDEIEVFVYRDSEDRLISTVTKPKLTLGEMEVLTVKAVSNIGAFLDWGLEKDLFLPFKEQTNKVKPGQTVLVKLYVDKSNRLSATMKIHKDLTAAEGYKKDDEVTGIIYEVHRELGAFIAVDNKYFGLVPKKEIRSNVEVGTIVNARVTSVREDGKLNLSLNKKSYMQMDDDAEKVLEVIEEYDGELPYGEKVSPDIIARDFGLSKGAFKRAVGKLYKERKIEIEADSIRIIQ